MRKALLAMAGIGMMAPPREYYELNRDPFADLGDSPDGIGPMDLPAEIVMLERRTQSTKISDERRTEQSNARAMGRAG